MGKVIDGHLSRWLPVQQNGGKANILKRHEFPLEICLSGIGHLMATSRRSKIENAQEIKAKKGRREKGKHKTGACVLTLLC